jgi:hypothetical protein
MSLLWCVTACVIGWMDLLMMRCVLFSLRVLQLSRLCSASFAFVLNEKNTKIFSCPSSLKLLDPLTDQLGFRKPTPFGFTPYDVEVLHHVFRMFTTDGDGVVRHHVHAHKKISTVLRNAMNEHITHTDLAQSSNIVGTPVVKPLHQLDLLTGTPLCAVMALIFLGHRYVFEYDIRVCVCWAHNLLLVFSGFTLYSLSHNGADAEQISAHLEAGLPPVGIHAWGLTSSSGGQVYFPPALLFVAARNLLRLNAELCKPDQPLKLRRVFNAHLKKVTLLHNLGYMRSSVHCKVGSTDAGAFIPLIVQSECASTKDMQRKLQEFVEVRRARWPWSGEKNPVASTSPPVKLIPLLDIPDPMEMKQQERCSKVIELLYRLEEQAPGVVPMAMESPPSMFRDHMDPSTAPTYVASVVSQPQEVPSCQVKQPQVAPSYQVEQPQEEHVFCTLPLLPLDDLPNMEANIKATNTTEQESIYEDDMDMSSPFSPSLLGDDTLQQHQPLRGVPGLLSGHYDVRDLSPTLDAFRAMSAVPQFSLDEGDEQSPSTRATPKRKHSDDTPEYSNDSCESLQSTLSDDSSTYGGTSDAHDIFSLFASQPYWGVNGNGLFS